MFHLGHDSLRRALLILTLGGLFLRGWGLFSASMTHYDEYYYAQSGAWVVVDRQTAQVVLDEAQAAGNVVGTPPARMAMLHPMQPLHAPILFPTLCGFAYWLHGGPWYAAGAWVSALLGTATIPLVYAIGRRFGGRGVSLLAATLFAGCDFHIAYSRAWLLDAGFCFFFALAMYCLIRLFETGAMRWMVAAGVATGMSWNVKYNGWMPLAIAGTAWLFSTLSIRWTDRTEGRPDRPIRQLLLLMAAGCIAALLYTPWFLFVEWYFPGGYARVNQHHRSFISVYNAWSDAERNAWPLLAGLQQWAFNGTRLLRELPAYRHWGWCLLILSATIGVAFALSRRPLRRRCLGWGSDSLLLLATSFIGLLCLGSAGVLLVIAAVTSVHLLLQPKAKPLEYLLVVWLGSFLILVPAYAAYSRLLVPALPAAAILVSCRCPGIRRGEPDVPSAKSSRWTGRGFINLTASLILASVTVFAGRGNVDELRGVWRCWPARNSYRELAELLRLLPASATLVCHTQPSLWFRIDRPYLDPLDQPLPSPAEVGSYYLALDSEIHSRPQAKASFLEHADQIVEVARVPNNMTPPALFNLPIVTPCLYWKKMGVLGQGRPAESVWREPRWLGPTAATAELPPPADQPAQDWIILYRVDRF